MSLAPSLRYQEALTELIMGLYLKKRREEKPLTFSPKDGKEEAREKAGGEGSQICVLIFYLPLEVPEGEDALEERATGGPFRSLGRDFLEYLSRGLHIKVNLVVWCG